jgi:phosphoglycerate dehydrogenase-like enzyme
MYLVRAGKWKETTWNKPGFVYGDLTGRRVGLAGFGSINRRYAELLAPFRCSVSACDPFVSNEILDRYGVKRAESLAELAQSCEIFVIGIPPTPTTMEIISESVINALPKGALLILVTRMAVVEQAVLWRRIEANEIAAAVDVFAPEPPPSDAWFRQHPNVLATPHIAGGTDFCHRRCFTDACKDAIAVLTGHKPVFQATTRDDDCYQGRL